MLYPKMTVAMGIKTLESPTIIMFFFETERKPGTLVSTTWDKNGLLSSILGNPQIKIVDFMERSPSRNMNTIATQLLTMAHEHFRQITTNLTHLHQTNSISVLHLNFLFESCSSLRRKDGLKHADNLFTFAHFSIDVHLLCPPQIPASLGSQKLPWGVPVMVKTKAKPLT